MNRSGLGKGLIAVALTATLAATGCGDRSAPGEQSQFERSRIGQTLDPERETIADLFGGGDDPNRTVEVNRYIWNAAQDVLDFLPVEAADPFSGVLVYGYGTPPGGAQTYRATVYVRDPALDARSLNVALATRSGPASPDTVRAIEDAILTRARQLRIQDSNL
ncbi:DUF3576 domain-containing protein [Tranquillimonas rosea]|nr:DUF3576 domain-containing protein [Tranquillimonas rosea]